MMMPPQRSSSDSLCFQAAGDYLRPIRSVCHSLCISHAYEKEEKTLVLCADGPDLLFRKIIKLTFFYLNIYIISSKNNLGREGFSAYASTIKV